jgi:molybdenum cofactor biosynthesis enzyme MoaA
MPEVENGQYYRRRADHLLDARMERLEVRLDALERDVKKGFDSVHVQINETNRKIAYIGGALGVIAILAQLLPSTLNLIVNFLR